MTALDRLTWTVAQALLNAAVRRWPDELSETMSREWRAELAALRADPTLGPATRARRTLAFAASLAWSPAVEATGAEAPGWRTRLAGLGRASSACAGVVGVALLAAALFNVVHYAYFHARDLLPGALGPIAEGALLAVAVAIMAWVGGAAARRATVRSATGRSATGRSATGAAVAYTVPLGAAMFGFLLAGNRVPVNPFMGWIDIVPGVAAWTVLTAAAVGVTTRLARSGRRRWALPVGGAMGAVALDCAAFAASIHAATTLRLGLASGPAWFPLSLLPGGTVSFGAYGASGLTKGAAANWSAPRASDVLLGNVSSLVGPLLLCTAFVLAYTVGSARGVAARPVEAATVAGGSRGDLLAGVVACGTGLASVAIWGYLSAVADPAVTGAADLRTPRLLAIVMIICAAIVAMAGRGPVAVPALVALLILLLGDAAVAHAHRHGGVAAATVAGITTGALCLAWMCSQLLAAGGGPAIDAAATATASRRALAATAVFCALVAPAAAAPLAWLSRQAPGPGYALAIVPWLIALTAALAGRERLGRTATVAVAVVALALTLVFVSGGGGRVTGQPYAPLFVQVPLGVLALAVARWDAARRWPRQAAGWVALAVAAALVSLPVAEALGQSSDVVAGALDRIVSNTHVFGFGFSATAAGQIALAAVLGIIAARWTVRTPVD